MTSTLEVTSPYSGDVVGTVEGPGIHAEEAETSIALAVGQRVLMEEATSEAWDRGEAVREAGHTWSSLGKYSLTAKGPGVTVPMDMLRDITESGVVGDARRATPELGQRIIDAFDIDVTIVFCKCLGPITLQGMQTPIGDRKLCRSACYRL